jgi:hypothetical protein
VPQLSVPPQPSATEPQLTDSAAQVVVAQAISLGGFKSGEGDAAISAAGGGHAPQSPGHDKQLSVTLQTPSPQRCFRSGSSASEGVGETWPPQPMTNAATNVSIACRICSSGAEFCRSIEGA